MKLSQLHFDLPPELIAQQPTRPADMAKLLILDKKSGKITDDVFLNITQYLKKGDLLIFNNSKVLPARLVGKKPSGGKIELLLLKQISKNQWECLFKKTKNRETNETSFKLGLKAGLEKFHDGTWLATFNFSGKKLTETILKIGQVPTPPYIKAFVKSKDYQNIYADPKKLGSAAAPTAGLHFTKRLFNKLKKTEVEIGFVTLHVGLGTFQPIRTENVEDHKIHSEYFQINKQTINQVTKARREKRRIIAVGTTSCRVLESIGNWKLPARRSLGAGGGIGNSGETSIFIYPGYTFKVIDGLITNFHTPHSSLLALVMALAGEKNIKSAYQHAINNSYKFFSLGDGMLIT